MIGSRRVSLILIGLFCCTLFAAQQSRDYYLDIVASNELFNKALLEKDESKAKELYSQAAENYEKIIAESGIQNSGLYYNLGNCYLREGNIGKAILNYRRAMKLDDSNYDLRQNLAIARSRRVDKIEINTQEKIAHRIFFWHYLLSTKVKFIVASSAALLFLWVLIFSILSIRVPAALPLSIVFLIVSCVFAASVLVDRYIDKNVKYGVIIADSTIARQGDGENYDKSFKEPLHSGVEFKILEQRRNWWHIELTNSKDTWIPADSAEVI